MASLAPCGPASEKRGEFLREVAWQIADLLAPDSNQWPVHGDSPISPGLDHLFETCSERKERLAGPRHTHE